MSEQRIEFGKNGREKLLYGAKTLAKAVKSTLGPGGRNCVFTLNGQPQVTKDGVTVSKQIKPVDPIEAIGASLIREASEKTAHIAGDGPQPLDTKILTPSGLVRFGDIKEGDSICGTSGTIQTVLGVFPKGEKEVYEVEFSNGRKTQCCLDHTWTVMDSKQCKVKDLTLKELLKNYRIPIKNTDSYTYRYYIPQTFVDFTEQEVEIDPYTLGVLLGDGGLSNTSNRDLIEIGLGYKKKHIIEKLVFPKGISFSITDNTTRHYYRIKIIGTDNNGNNIKYYLNQLGLLGTTSHTKFIPQKYLYNTKAIRTQLLQGLIDTDGTINKRGRFEFSTVSEVLASDFNQLVLGLGKVLSSYKRDRIKDKCYSDKPIYRFVECKGYKHGVKLCNIRKLDNIVPMQCIKVSNEDQLYITDDYLVTHNTTSSVVLAEAILEQGCMMLASGLNAISLQRGILSATKTIVNYLRDNIKMDCSPQRIKDVVLVSTNWDEEIANLISEAIIKVGINGSVTVNDSRTPYSSVRYLEGMQIERGYLSPYFITNQAKQECVFENPYILLSGKKITNNAMLQPILVAAFECGKSKRPLVIIAPDIEQEALTTMVINKLKGIINLVAIKCPGYGDKMKDYMGDLAVTLNGTYFTDILSREFTTLVEADFGSCEKIVIDKDKTTFINGSGSKEAIEERINFLKETVENNPESWEARTLKERIAKMTDGVAIIDVGATTESELLERQDRVDDAICAARAAIEEGIVPGGGTALAKLKGKKLPYEQGDHSFNVGVKIVQNALTVLLKQLLINAGLENPDVIINNVCKKGNNIGFNIKTEKYVDMIDSGIIDPFKVTRSALENAASVAGLILTTECLVTNEVIESGKKE